MYKCESASDEPAFVLIKRLVQKKCWPPSRDERQSKQNRHGIKRFIRRFFIPE
jgi:hypothetical protein